MGGGPPRAVKALQQSTLLTGRKHTDVAVQTDADGVPHDEVGASLGAVRGEPGGQASHFRDHEAVFSRHEGEGTPGGKAFSNDSGEVPSTQEFCDVAV